jgi:hypothetical protein
MGLDLTDRKAEEAIKKANERFELIASATNDALFELDFSGENWHNKVSYNNLNCTVMIYPLRKIKHYGDLSCILTIEIELLKVLKNVMLGPQILVRDFRF